LFLEETWRLHPKICAFTSEVFYESRLQSRPGLDRQRITSKSRITGSGLRYLPVSHEGNQNSAPEEADQIQLLVTEILSSRSVWTDREDVVPVSTTSSSSPLTMHRSSSCRSEFPAEGSALSTSSRGKKPPS
jgi:hypothetical protein